MTAEPFRLLFVCTGNTCRSPLAEALARREAEARGWTQFRVSSAGVAAGPGEPASSGSVAAAEAVGLDLSAHRATLLTAEVAEGADLLLVMSPHHLYRALDLGAGEYSTLLTAFAEGLDEDAVFDAPGIPDPFGGPLDEYERTRDHLDALVRRVLDRLEPVVSP